MMMEGEGGGGKDGGEVLEVDIRVDGRRPGYMLRE